MSARSHLYLLAFGPIPVRRKGLYVVACIYVCMCACTRQLGNMFQKQFYAVWFSNLMTQDEVAEGRRGLSATKPKPAPKSKAKPGNAPKPKPKPKSKPKPK